LLPSFPFGSDFTATEQRLIPALQVLQQVQRTPLKVAGIAVAGIYAPAGRRRQRMPGTAGLDKPETLAERGYRALVSAALVRSRAE